MQRFKQLSVQETKVGNKQDMCLSFIFKTGKLGMLLKIDHNAVSNVKNLGISNLGQHGMLLKLPYRNNWSGVSLSNFLNLFPSIVS